MIFITKVDTFLIQYNFIIIAWISSFLFIIESNSSVLISTGDIARHMGIKDYEFTFYLYNSFSNVLLNMFLC